MRANLILQTPPALNRLSSSMLLFLRSLSSFTDGMGSSSHMASLPLAKHILCLAQTLLLEFCPGPSTFFSTASEIFKPPNMCATIWVINYLYHSFLLIQTPVFLVGSPRPRTCQPIRGGERGPSVGWAPTSRLAALGSTGRLRLSKSTQYARRLNPKQADSEGVCAISSILLLDLQYADILTLFFSKGATPVRSLVSPVFSWPCHLTASANRRSSLSSLPLSGAQFATRCSSATSRSTTTLRTTCSRSSSSIRLLVNLLDPSALPLVLCFSLHLAWLLMY